MALKDATATLTTTLSMAVITGYVPIRFGDLDETSGTVKATGQIQWSAVNSWDTWTSYIGPADNITWTSDIQDLGEVKYFTLDIQTRVTGRVLSYMVYTSETGGFGGEETMTYIVEGDYNVPAFYGRYYAVQVKIDGNEMFAMSMTASSDTKSVRLSNVNTSTLPGTSASRTLSINYPVSAILDIDVKAQAPTAYAVNLYVSDTPTSQLLIPIVKSKSSTSPQIALYGIDNDTRDGIVDITITALPRQVMFGGNLTVIY